MGLPKSIFFNHLKRILTGNSSVRIILLYVLFGALWIAVSDHVLELLVTNAHQLTVLQSEKGLLFVVASAFVLFAAVRREFRARERAEDALRETGEKYRQLMLGANDGIVIADGATGVILEVNRKIEELTGREAGELVGRHFSELHPASEIDRCRKLLEEVLANKSSLANQLCLLQNGDAEVPVEVSASLLEINGKPVVMGIFRNITARKIAEEAGRKEKERAEQYLDVAGVILRVLDRNGVVTLINKKGSEILGYPEAEITGKNWFEYFVPDRLKTEVRLVFARIISGEAELSEYYENPVVTRSGEERAIAWQNTILRDDQGLVTGTLSSGEDITARKKAEEQARSRHEHLTTLHAIDQVISSSLDLRMTLEQFLNLVITQLHVDAADVLLLNAHTQMLEYGAMQGFRNARIRSSLLRIGEGIAGKAALERRSIGIPNLRDASSGFVRGRLLEGEDFIAYYVVPLIAKGQVKGVLEILHRTPLSFDEEWVNFLEALASQAAIAIDNAALFNDVQRSNAELILAYDTTIAGWARALELRDKETEGHTQRAAEMTLRIARVMHLKEEDLVHVRRGALLHDIGKMTIPDSVLLKNGPLTNDEWTLMRRHPAYAFELLAPIAYLRPAIDIPYCHHERWDGTGYPRGLKGEQIPLAARIFALADTWDALYSDRRYRAAWSEEQVREHIRSLSGTQLDPVVVEIFLGMERADIEEIKENTKTG